MRDIVILGVFITLLLICDTVTGIFVNCVINKEQFKSAKLKKGLYEKGIELLIIGTVYLGKQTTLADVLEVTHLSEITISMFALQEGVSIYENLKKIK